MLMLLPFHFSDAPRKVWSELLVWSSPKHFLLWIHGGCCSSLIEAKQGRSSCLRSERLMIIIWANTPTATLNKRKHSGFTANFTKSANMQMCSQICVLFCHSLFINILGNDIMCCLNMWVDRHTATWISWSSLLLGSLQTRLTPTSLEIL